MKPGGENIGGQYSFEQDAALTNHAAGEHFGHHLQSQRLARLQVRSIEEVQLDAQTSPAVDFRALDLSGDGGEMGMTGGITPIKQATRFRT